MPRKASSKRKSGRRNGLTPIPQSIHWAATSEPIDPESEAENERDRIDIDNFLDTLAEVALAIVARKLRPELAEGLASQQSEGEE